MVRLLQYHVCMRVTTDDVGAVGGGRDQQPQLSGVAEGLTLRHCRVRLSVAARH